MTRYLVTWEIDVWADNPIDAAVEALAAQRNHQSTATAFDVIRAEPFEVTHVDLEDHYDRVVERGISG